jgi:hypothetical protein
VPIQFYESLSAPNPVMEQITSSGNSSIPIIVTTTGEASPNLPLSTVRPPWSRLQLRRTVDRPHLSRWPHLLTHLVRQALRFHMVCLVQVRVLHSLLPLYRIWVWGKGALTLLCKVNSGEFLSLSMLFLTLGVISLLHPLRLVDCISSPPGQPAHTSPLGAGSQGTPAQTQPVGSSPFVWNGMFGNNTFASTSFPSGGTPIFGQSTPAQGTIPALGAHIPGPWNSGQGSVPSSGMSFWGNSFHRHWNPGQTSMPLLVGLAWGNPSQSPFKHDERPPSYVLHGESANDVSSNEKPLHWSGPRFLPKPRPATKLFLATWCQSNPRTLLS